MLSKCAYCFQNLTFDVFCSLSSLSVLPLPLSLPPLLQYYINIFNFATIAHTHSALKHLALYPYPSPSPPDCQYVCILCFCFLRFWFIYFSVLPKPKKKKPTKNSTHFDFGRILWSLPRSLCDCATCATKQWNTPKTKPNSHTETRTRLCLRNTFTITISVPRSPSRCQLQNDS